MDENAANQQKSLSQKKSQEAKKEKTGKSGVSKYAPAMIWLTSVFVVGMVIGNFLWLITADVLAFGREDRVVEITVESSDTITDISHKLAQEGLVSYPGLFRLFARISGTADQFGPGTYQLNTKYDYPALAKILTKRPVRTDASLPLL